MRILGRRKRTLKALWAAARGTSTTLNSRVMIFSACKCKQPRRLCPTLPTHPPAPSTSALLVLRPHQSVSSFWAWRLFPLLGNPALWVQLPGPGQPHSGVFCGSHCVSSKCVPPEGQPPVPCRSVSAAPRTGPRAFSECV